MHTYTLVHTRTRTRTHAQTHTHTHTHTYLAQQVSPERLKGAEVPGDVLRRLLSDVAHPESKQEPAPQSHA